MSVKPYYHDADSGIQIYHADAREILPNLSADTIIVDPVWPNSSPHLAGHDDPFGLFAEIAQHFPSVCQRAVIHLGVDSDPRFLLGVPASMPFIRACWLEYVRAVPKGRILYTGDVAYGFGVPPVAKPGRMVIPGRYLSRNYDFVRPQTMPSRSKAFEGRFNLHPCPRRLEHVAWLVKWFAENTVIDPCCGIGTTLLAAKNAGLTATGIEINERYVEIAARRLSQGVLPFTEAKA